MSFSFLGTRGQIRPRACQSGTYATELIPQPHIFLLESTASRVSSTLKEHFHQVDVAVGGCGIQECPQINIICVHITPGKMNFLDQFLKGFDSVLVQSHERTLTAQINADLALQEVVLYWSFFLSEFPIGLS